MAHPDSRIVLSRAPRRDFLIAAIHGGHIEPGTSEITKDIAKDTYSRYAFEGLRKKGAFKDLHTTSHLFREPAFLALAAQHDEVITIHGCRDEWGDDIRLGGLDEKLKGKLVAAFQKAGFSAHNDNKVFTGKHPENVCNRGMSKQGVQIEIPEALRTAPAQRDKIARVIRDVLKKESGV